MYKRQYLPLGDDEYVRRRGRTFDQIDALFNFDAVGLRSGPNTVAGFNLSPALQADVTATLAHFPEVAWTQPWPESNHSTFAFRGVPSLAFTAKTDAPHYHLRSDTIEQISRERLDEMVLLGGKLVETLAMGLRVPA